MTKLTARQEQAAVLLAEDRYSDERIAASVGISRRTLAKWKREEKFAARIQEMISILAAVARRRGIARKARRVAILNETHGRLLQIIDERAADPTMADVPGGTTGHVVRRPVVFGAKVVGYEYAVDIRTIKQLQSLQEQVAKELGQLVDRVERRISSIKDLTDEELEGILASIEAEPPLLEGETDPDRHHTVTGGLVAKPAKP